MECVIGTRVSFMSIFFSYGFFFSYRVDKHDACHLTSFSTSCVSTSFAPTDRRYIFFYTMFQDIHFAKLYLCFTRNSETWSRFESSRENIFVTVCNMIPFILRGVMINDILQSWKWKYCLFVFFNRKMIEFTLLMTNKTN